MECWHMSGAGNDFAVIDARGLELDFSALAKKLCAQLGADGFMAVDYAQTADFRLHFYNADGSRGEMCGNGSRCICKFAYDHALAGEHMVIETDAGMVFGQRLGAEHYRVKLNEPSILDLKRRPDAAYVELGNPGVPHSVTELPELEWEMSQALLPKALELRHDPVFPKGVNVNLYTRLSDTALRLLTYERGVEDYTLACGTGSTSVAVVLWSQGKLPGGVLTAQNRGGTLTVTVEGTGGQISALYLEGPATVLKKLDI